MKTRDEAMPAAPLGAGDQRRSASEPEQQLWRVLGEAFPQHSWRRQMPVGPYFADFACLGERLVIELDGSSPVLAGGYDEVRTCFLHAQGFRLLRFRDSDVAQTPERVIAAVAQALSRRETAGTCQPHNRDDDTRAAPSPARAFAAHQGPAPGTTARGRQ